MIDLAWKENRILTYDFQENSIKRKIQKKQNISHGNPFFSKPTKQKILTIIHGTWKTGEKKKRRKKKNAFIWRKSRRCLICCYRCETHPNQLGYEKQISPWILWKSIKKEKIFTTSKILMKTIYWEIPLKESGYG